MRKKLTVLMATAFMLAMMLASAGMDLKRRRRSVARSAPRTPPSVSQNP